MGAKASEHVSGAFFDAPGRNRTCLQTGAFPPPIHHRSTSEWRK
jgi:hypothetical protein